MLYSKTVFDSRYLKVPDLHFTKYFERNYKDLPSMQDLITSGGFKGCCGARFIQTETGVHEVTFFDELRKVNILSWSTKNFKGEDRICACAVFELLPDNTWYLWNILFTTCDPFFFDNFTQPLGMLLEGPRATFSQKSGEIMLHNDLPPVENRVFFVNKIQFMKQRMADKMQDSQSFLADLRELAMTSRNMDRVFLRMILERYAKHIKTAEESRDSSDKVMTSLAFDCIKSEELAALREVVQTLTPQQFYDLYLSCLNGLLEYPINLLPAEYKKFGRRLLMFKDDCEEWDRLVFLLILAARTELVAESPFDSSLGLGSGARVFCEVSDDDARFAEKTPVDIVDSSRKIKLGDVGPNWILRTTEKVVERQEAFLGELKDLLVQQDFDGAIRKLTDGTATPKFGQGLLGLSINLLRSLMTGVIMFPKNFEIQIQTMFKKYNIDWSLPLLSIGFDAEEPVGRGIDLLFQLGAPVRDNASD